MHDFYQYCRHHNVDQHQIDIVSKSCTFFLVDNVDIAMLFDIESTSCLHRTSYPVCIVNIVDIAILTNIQSTLCVHCGLFFLVYIVDIVYIAMLIDIELCSCLYRTFLSCFIAEIVDVEILTNIESILCSHHSPSFLFTSSTSQC